MVCVALILFSSFLNYYQRSVAKIGLSYIKQNFLQALTATITEIQAASVLLKKAYNCPNVPSPTPLTMDLKIKRTFSNNTQLIEYSMDIPYAIHTNTLATAKIEYNVLGNTWTSLVKLDDKKGMCDLFNTNGKDLWFDVQKEIGMTPRACPIAQGKYHGDRVPLYLTKYRISTIPPGNYRATIEVRDKSNDSIILCKMFDIEDKA